ncbi:IS1634 family transposase [Lentibacillus jeotgali]|uniref:IS1634 family transposase n=1 Tax=Lentibacillus jeotgali TaxID=558169 RepID=UPI0002628884|nr:IS1634 family transposase [Lentibacillus jeotgali]
MFLRKMKNKKTGRIYLSIVQSYRDKETKKTRSKTIQSLGYLDELEKEYTDPVSHFKDEIRKMNQEQAEKDTSITLSMDKNQRLQKDETNRKNLGYAALSKVYHELGIHTFLKNRQRHTNSDYDANSIMKLLTYGRLLYPASKKHTYEMKDTFFEKTDFSLDDVYRCLSFLNKHKDELQRWMHKRIQEQYGRNTSLVYYDVTNYYFEIDEQDDVRRKGVSKEHRPDPIIQMGLFMDTDGIPITYGLHPGNMLDKQTFIPMLREIQKNFDLGRTIVVADKGMTTGDNIWYTLSANNGYILSYSIRGANRKFKEYVLNQNGYRSIGEDFKIKSRLEPREITVTSRSGKKIKKQVDEKQVIFYSRKYAQKAKADRAEALHKAKDLVNNPSKYNKATTYGAAKYVKNLAYDKKTGELLKNSQKTLFFDEEKLRKEEELDGYYAIMTSEYKETDEKIIDLYRGLWKIEESFKITKSDISSRPVYLSRQEHIESHFLTCFVSLVIARLLERRLAGKYSVKSILESLQKASCSHLQENYYLLDTFDDVLMDIKEKLGIDLGQKYMSLKEIKKILGETKIS